MDLYPLLQEPLPYQKAPSIWTGEHMSAQMLAAHLESGHNSASYNDGWRERICRYLWEALDLEPGKRLADCGCGPGLYTHRFAAMGAAATGIDLSRRSIDYAEERVREDPVTASYLCQSYLNPFGAGCFDAAVMISKDYGVLSPENRKRLLENIRAALVPGGSFALDVTSDTVWDTLDSGATWVAEEKGFYRPHPYVLLQKRWLYPGIRAYCDAYTVIDGEITQYLVYQTLFTPERIRGELEEAGFAVRDILDNLDGSLYTGTAPQIGVVAQKV